jgi:hypothetical protein
VIAVAVASLEAWLRCLSSQVLRSVLLPRASRNLSTRATPALFPIILIHRAEDGSSTPFCGTEHTSTAMPNRIVTATFVASVTNATGPWLAAASGRTRDVLEFNSAYEKQSR